MVARRVAVLALQGDFERHLVRLAEIGAEGYAARLPSDIDSADAIVLPGGESTTIGKLLARYEIDTAIRRAHEAGKPIFGTCAGMILLAREIARETAEHGGQSVLGLMDIKVARNAYGRQIDSFEAILDPPPDGAEPVGQNLEAVFIRAPVILSWGSDVEVLAMYGGKPVLVRQGSLLASSFHPELTADRRIHEWFLKLLDTATT